MAFLFGDKSKFAIEVDITKSGDSPFGFVLIWLDGVHVGAHEDEVPILVFLHRIKRISGLEIKGCNFPADSGDVFFRKIMSVEIEGGDQYRLGLGESFDDFSMIGYRADSSVTIVWRLGKAPFFEYPDYPKGIQIAEVPVDMFTDVLSRFEQFIAAHVALH